MRGCAVGGPAVLSFDVPGEAGTGELEPPERSWRRCRGGDGIRSPLHEILIPHPGPLYPSPGIVTATLAARTRQRRPLAGRPHPARRLGKKVGPSRRLLVRTATAALPASSSHSFPLLDELLLLGLAVIAAMVPIRAWTLRSKPAAHLSKGLPSRAQCLWWRLARRMRNRLEQGEAKRACTPKRNTG
jgi:hypothetical protein